MKVNPYPEGYDALVARTQLSVRGRMPSSPYQTLLPDWRDRLQRLMKERRFNARSLSLAAGLGASTISEWLNPRKLKQPSLASARAVAEALQVSLDAFFEPPATEDETAPDQFKGVDGTSAHLTQVAYAELVGVVEAGAFRDPNMYAVEELRSIPIVPHPDFTGFQQFAWKVVGNSMNKVAEPGSYVIGVSFYDIRRRRELRSGDLVICEMSHDGLREYTLKRVTRVNGKYRLDPESTDSKFDGPVWTSDDPHGENQSVKATHLIIGKYALFV
jgi:transcriptional regulator with XRE-family HTH domain